MNRISRMVAGASIALCLVLSLGGSASAAFRKHNSPHESGFRKHAVVQSPGFRKHIVHGGAFRKHA